MVPISVQRPAYALGLEREAPAVPFLVAAQVSLRQELPELVPGSRGAAAGRAARADLTQGVPNGSRCKLQTPQLAFDPYATFGYSA